MNKILSFCLLMILFYVNTSYGQEKIVFIDINYIFKNSNAGKDLHSQILNKDSELKKEIRQFKEEIENERNLILSQKNVLSEEEYNKKVNILETKIKSMNSEISDKNNELALFKKKIEALFSKQLNIIIEEYSVKNSINIIFSKDNLLMAKKNLDITEEVFNLFNQKFDKIELK